jgi:hypothetical protein
MEADSQDLNKAHIKSGATQQAENVTMHNSRRRNDQVLNELGASPSPPYLQPLQ